MSETFVEAQKDDEEIDGTGLICPECGKRCKNAISLGKHRSSEHQVAGKHSRPPRQPGAPPSKGARGAEINRLRRELRKDVSALCLLPFMAKGTAGNLTNPAVAEMIEEKASAFADAWATAAEQNEWVRQNLTRVMAGGIWLNVAAQTAALGYCVAVFSGVIPLHPGALMLMPEMGQFVFSTEQKPGAKAPEGAA